MPEEFISQEVGAITCHTFVTSSDAAVDAWVQHFHAFMAAAPPEHAFYYLFDISGEDVVFTPYARESTAKLFAQYRHRKGYMAFIMAWVTGPHIAKLFFSGLGVLEFSVEYFATVDAGLAWLQAQQQQTP